MIHTGFHSEKVWMVILFQLVATFATMYYNNFVIYNMNIDDNIFIKYLSNSDSSSNYWIYNIDDINYYIPNLGYMVIIDSNYKNLDNGNNTLNYSKSGLYKREQSPKILSNIIYDSKNPEIFDNEIIIKNNIKECNE